MSDVTRDEFDRLVGRVTRVEHTLGATVELVSSEVVGLRTYLGERFADVDEQFEAIDVRFERVDRRFDHQDRMLDALATEVQVEFDRQSDKVDALTVGHGRKLDALLAHFDIDPPG